MLPATPGPSRGHARGHPVAVPWRRRDGTGRHRMDRAQYVRKSSESSVMPVRPRCPSTTKGDLMALRDSMRDSAAPYLGPGEPIQAVIGAQTASQWLAALTGVFVFLGFNHYRILAVTPARILVLDAGKTSMKKARGVVTELPRSTRLGPAAGPGDRIPAGDPNPRGHRRFLKDIQAADNALVNA